MKKLYIIPLIMILSACGVSASKTEKSASSAANDKNLSLEFKHYDEKPVQGDACPKGVFDYYRQYYTFDIPEYFEGKCYIRPVENEGEKYYISRFSRGEVKSFVAYADGSDPEFNDYDGYFKRTYENRCRRCRVGEPEKTELNGMAAYFRETRINSLPPSDEHYGLIHEYVIPAKKGFYVLWFQYSNLRAYDEHKADFEKIKKSFKGILAQ